MSSKIKQRRKDSKTDKSETSRQKSTDISSNEYVDVSTNNNSPIKIDYKRIVIRCIIIIGIIFIVNLTHKNNLETFASQKEEIKKKIVFSCSNDFIDDVKRYPDCAPKNCGRFVSDMVVTLSEVQALLIIAQKGLSLGGSDGGASILDLHSGALSKGNSFTNIYTLDKAHKVITNEDLKIYKHVKDKVKAVIVENFNVNPNKLYLAHPTFFSRMTSVPAKTIHDEYWHPHVDKETYKSFHYTSLLYLTDYSEHFDGGRFVFIDKDANRTVEPKAGRVSAFTSGSENLHYVEPVKSGTRFAITIAFTCDPKQGIKDPQIPKQ